MKENLLKTVISILAALAIFGILFNLSPYYQMYFHAKNQTAAAYLDKLNREELGPYIVDCVNSAGVGKWWRTNNHVETTAYSHWAQENLSKDHYVVTGRIGTHITWIALIPLNEKPTSAYDFYKVAGSTMWSRRVPPTVAAAFKECGVEFEEKWTRHLSSTPQLI